MLRAVGPYLWSACQRRQQPRNNCSTKEMDLNAAGEVLIAPAVSGEKRMTRCERSDQGGLHREGGVYTGH